MRAPRPVMALAPFASLSMLALIITYPVCTFSETAQACGGPPDAGPGGLGQRGRVLQWMGEVIVRGIADDLSVRALWEEVQRLLSEEVHRVGLRHHDARPGRARGCRGAGLRGHRCREAARRDRRQGLGRCEPGVQSDVHVRQKPQSEPGRPPARPAAQGGGGHASNRSDRLPRGAEEAPFLIYSESTPCCGGAAPPAWWTCM